MKRRIIAALAAVALGLGVFAAGAAPAYAGPQTVVKHVALGDSVAAGQGGGVPLDACLRTAGGYGSQLDALPKVNMLRNAACTGATIETTWAQLSQINRGTTVVTLTVGANDLGLDQVYGACAAILSGGAPAAAACVAAIAEATAAAPQLVEPLRALISEVAMRSPNATIVVTGYPHLFASPPPLPQFAELATLVGLANGATDALNLAIQGAVAASGANAEYADVVGLFAPHGVQLVPGVPSDAWFGFDLAGDPTGYLHPTYAGYTAYAQAILAKL